VAACSRCRDVIAGDVGWSPLTRRTRSFIRWFRQGEPVVQVPV
jgi:hypothetical protein